MNKLFLDTALDDYDLFNDGEDIDLYDDELDEIETDEYGPEFLPEYEEELFDDLTELAESLREAVHENYQDAAPEEMEEALLNILDEMTPAEAESFTGALRKVGRVGVKLVTDPTTAQVAGGVIGSFVGTPGVGTVAGVKTAQAVTQAFSGGKKVPSTQSSPSTPTQSSTQVPPGGPVTGTDPGQPAAQASQGEKKEPAAPALPQISQTNSSSAQKLINLRNSHLVKNALVAALLGEAGKRSISLGNDGPRVSVAEILQLISSVAGEAASEADRLLWESEETHSYLLDSEGEYVADPADDADRGQALYNKIINIENQTLTGRQVSSLPWSAYLPFARGSRQEVGYETPIGILGIGIGSILERSSNLLKAKIYIEPWDQFNIPETYIMLMIEYVQEGPGNRAVIVVNDQQYTDNNVTIRSGEGVRQVFIQIEFRGQEIKEISISKENSKKAKLKFNAGESQHVLVLTNY